MTRLYQPTEGGIFIDGINIDEFSLASLYKCISVVFQDFMKYPFTVKENIGFGDIENLDDIDRIELSAKKANAYKFIQSLENKFDTRLEKLWSNGVELSLGQWQKLAISRAFKSDSSLLILDEPTASVDAETEYELFKNFKELVGNRTSILISHRFSTVRMADLIIVLNEGTVIEKGTHKSLMLKEGLYSKLYNMQLFMPFGFLLPTLWGKFGKNLWTIFCYGLFFSFTIEISQLFISSRTTDIDDIITNILGTICGWVVFNIMRKVFYKFANKTVVHICSSDTLAIKLEFYLYIVIAIVCTFCFCSI